ncbi:MAG: hypothetical protein AAF810_08760 [Cyanobacteria bacterium P01_D01_bin.36]
MIDFSILLAQVATPDVDPAIVDRCLDSIFSPDDAALSCGAVMSQQAAQAWDDIWQQKVAIASPEFIATMNISRYVAAPAIGFWAIDAIRSVGRNMLVEWPRFFVTAVLVFVLYANNGAIARNTILASRALINYQNSEILQLANAGNDYELKMAELADFGIVENEIVQYREQCNGITVNEEMLACLNRASQYADDALQEYINEHGTTQFATRLERYSDKLIKEPQAFIADVVSATGVTVAGGLLGGPPGSTLAGIAAPVLGKVANSAIGLATEGILAHTNQLVQHIVEASWLFTAVIVPIPLALAFYRGMRSAIFGWAIGFLSLGMFKINLNLASSLIVGMIYQRGPGEPVLDLALMSLGVIILALAMTAGGGMAIFAGITTAISGLTLGLVNIAASGGLRR